MTPSVNWGMIFIMPAFVQLSWKMWAVTDWTNLHVSGLEERFDCWRGLMMLSSAGRQRPQMHQISSLGGWQHTIYSQQRIKELGLSQAKVLKTQRSLHLDKRTSLRRKMNRKKENDLESIKCYKPQNCKMPEMRKENVQLKWEFQSWNGWKLYACHNWRRERGTIDNYTDYALDYISIFKACVRRSVTENINTCLLAEHGSLVWNARIWNTNILLRGKNWLVSVVKTKFAF